MNTDIITILGPTASGKTTLAVALAHRLGSEIISADSRQLYRDMDIGTGKDLSEYQIEGETVPYHLIDICPPGYKYNLFEYHRDFQIAYQQITTKGKLPVLCGGTGLYIESVLKGYQLPPVPENNELRAALEGKELPELAQILASYKTLHNHTDTDTRKRAIRAIEIAHYMRENGIQTETSPTPPLQSLIIGVDIERELRRTKISARLTARLEEGMVAEVEALLATGIPPEDLIYYGLEYKYLTEYIIGTYTYTQMVEKLEIAIHQFAKRQMTWFRGMERRGAAIHWIDAQLPTTQKVDSVLQLLHDKG